MKVLGEKSLASKVLVILYILLVVISIVSMIAVGIIGKTINHIVLNENIEMNIFDASVYSIIIITGIVALFITFQFIEIFKKLKSNDLFCEENAKRLDAICISSFIVSVAYFIIAMIMYYILKIIMVEIVGYISILSIIFATIFLIVGIGFKVLNAVYKQAIEEIGGKVTDVKKEKAEQKEEIKQEEKK